MASCEKCWADANGYAGRQGSVSDEYQRLIRERPPCTPEQQAGTDATMCPNCDRRTVHQYAKVCMCGCGYGEKEIKDNA